MTEEIVEYELGDIDLVSGKILKSAVLIAKSWGQLSAARDNVIVLPTYYTGTHDSYAPLVGPGNVFDTKRYFVLSPNLFGNGLSTSPSNAVDSISGAHFPTVDVYDNVLCQHRLLIEKFGITDIQLVRALIEALRWRSESDLNVLAWQEYSRRSPESLA